MDYYPASIENLLVKGKKSVYEITNSIESYYYQKFCQEFF